MDPMGFNKSIQTELQKFEHMELQVFGCQFIGQSVFFKGFPLVTLWKTCDIFWTESGQVNVEKTTLNKNHTVDGWNPANQLRLVVYPIIYRVSAPSQVVQDFSHQQ